MSNRLNLITAACLVGLATLSGCMTPPVAQTTPDASVLAELAVYANRSSSAMATLANLRGANAGIYVTPETKAPDGLEVPISISWSGPVEALVRKIAELSSYEYGGTIGKQPATPILVSLSVTNTSAFDILANAGAQAGSAVDIVVSPDTKKISVRFPPTTQTGGYVVSTGAASR